jgi:hypothetical protein
MERFDDPQTAIRPIPALFPQGQSEDRQASQPWNLQVARGRREARTRRAVFQTALTALPIGCMFAEKQAVHNATFNDWEMMNVGSFQEIPCEVEEF